MVNDTQETDENLEVGKEKSSSNEIDTRIQTALASLEKRIDLEGSARYCKALCRRRVVQTALNLLRLVMVYSLTDYSLRMVGLWGTVMGWGSLSKSGVRKRLRQCQQWFGTLITLVLLSGKMSMPKADSQLRLRLIDVTNVSQPGSRKIDWRLHLSFSLAPFRIDDVQLTNKSVGETLTHWQFDQDDLCLADRVYGVPRSLGVLFGALAFFVIRIGWQNLPLQDREGKPFAISTWLRVQSPDPTATPAQTKLWVVTPQGRFPIRLIARAIPPEKAMKIRQSMQAEAKHKKRCIDERTLLAAGFVMVVSNLPDTWSACDILSLYRFRWQIELVFKRLKGLLSFDHLRATDPHLAQVYLLTKILVALLLGDTQWRIALASPITFQNPERPVSIWRLTQLLLEAFRHSICGTPTWPLIQSHWPLLARYLCDDPRCRRRQLDSFHHLEVLCGF